MSNDVITVLEPIPDFEPTLEQRMDCTRMVACGLSVIEIAFFFNIEPLVCQRVFEQELKHGTAYWVGQVGGAMIKSAMGGDVNAQRAFLGMRGRWAAPTRAESNNGLIDDEAVAMKRKLMDAIMSMVNNKVAATDAESKQQIG